jgi:hypothetical protein
METSGLLYGPAVLLFRYQLDRRLGGPTLRLNDVEKTDISWNRIPTRQSLSPYRSRYAD